MGRAHANRGHIRPISASVAELASRQHGVVARRQLLNLGVPARTITRWVKDAYLHQLHRGIYAVGHILIGLDGHRMAAVLLAGPGSFLSHWAAADLAGIMRVDERNFIHVSRRTKSGASPTGIVLHRCPELEPIDTTQRRNIPATTTARTLFDLTPFLSARALAKAFERAEYLQSLDRSRLRALSSEARGHRGIANLRALLADIQLPVTEVRSSLEPIILRTCREYGLPIPAVNVPLLGYEVDFLWERERFVVEVDGGHHRGPQRDRDNERDVQLGRAGYLIRRYSEAALSDLGAVAGEVAAILKERVPT